MHILRDLLRKRRICCHEEEKGKLNRQHQSKNTSARKKIKGTSSASPKVSLPLMSAFVWWSSDSSAWPDRRSLSPHGPGGLTDGGAAPTLTSSYTANLQGHACYPTINKDEQKTERSEALRGPSAATLASTMTTQPGCPR